MPQQDPNQPAPPTGELFSTRNSKEAPQISRMVLYAERSIHLGNHCQVSGGEVGVRSLMAQPPKNGPAQLRLGPHTRCGHLFSPSTLLEEYAEADSIWTNSLDRSPHTTVAYEFGFPAAGMPVLPLSRAFGTGSDVTVARNTSHSLAPGSYGAVTLLENSEMWLAPGAYTFGSVNLGPHAKLLAHPGGVKVMVVGAFRAEQSVTIGPHRRELAAADLAISVGGTDTIPPHIAHDLPHPETVSPSTAVVALGENSDLHALLAAPHGTVLIAPGTRVRGAIAGFDVVVREHVQAEFQSGFPDSPPGQSGSQQLSGYVGKPEPTLGPLVGPIPADTEISLAIGLPVRDPAGLASFLHDVSDPFKPIFRQFLTQAEFAATYGATASDYAALQDWAQNYAGFTIKATYSNNLLLTVRGTAAQLQMALYVNLFFRRRQDGSKFVAADRNPSLDLSVPVLEISGLNDFTVAHAKDQNGSGANNLYSAADLRNAYLGVGSSFQALDGTGQVVGVMGYVLWDPGDINGYTVAQLPNISPNVTTVVSEGVEIATAQNSDREATGDIEMVLAMAPGAQVLYFQGHSGITNHMDDILHSMATFTTPLTVATCSLGFGYSDNANQAVGQMAANGVTFFTASGDAGDIGSNDSGCDKFTNQTLVGGTFLNTNPLTAPPPNTGYPNPYYNGETTWVVLPGNATQGGVMSGVPIPDYQVGVSMATNGGSTTERNYPDVAIVAEALEIVFQQQFTSFNGTSAAAPLWAGFMALVNQQNQLNGGPGKSGFINPTIYDIGLTRGSATDLYSLCFNDIADGANNNVGGGGSGFTSVAGYDLCTGWGTPTAALLNQLATQSPLTPNEPLTLIRFVIVTGADSLGGGRNGSGAFATVMLKNGGSFNLPLKEPADAAWPSGPMPPIDFQIPATDSSGNPVPTLTETNGIAGVSITMFQHNPNYAADNWDIANLSVSLFNPGSSFVCQLNLIGNSVLQDNSVGLIRLSLTPGSSGSGPTTPVFATGPGSGC